MTAVKLEELRLDVQEMKTLLSTATRQRVKDILSLDLRKLEDHITRLQEQVAKEAEQPKASGSASTTVASGSSKCYDVKIMNYAWDQSDGFVKLFITLKNVHTLPAENITCEFLNKSVKVCVNGLENRNHHLSILNLFERIEAQKSYVKVKHDNLVIYMAKSRSGEKWSNLTGVEKQVTEKKKQDTEPNDPASSVMGLLQQMFVDGDDETKRLIAKAWVTQQDTQGNMPGLPNMPGMPNMPSF